MHEGKIRISEKGRKALRQSDPLAKDVQWKQSARAYFIISTPRVRSLIRYSVIHTINIKAR